jgi:hypothetical protein
MLLAVLSCQSANDPEEVLELSLSLSSLTFEATAGEGNPPAHAVSVTNAGTGTLTGLGVSTTYGTGQPTGWLEATLNATTAPATLTLRPATAALAAGEYGATVSVTSPDAINSPQAVGITLTVTALLPQTIGLARQATDGTSLVLVGTVTGSFRLGGGQYKSYIQDETGGIALFPTTQITVGSSVRVNGTRATVYSEAQVAVTSMAQLGPGAPVTPRLIGPAEISDGSAEGQLVQVISVEVEFFDPLLGVVRVVFGDGQTTLEIDATYLEGIGPGTIGSVTGVLAREAFGLGEALGVLRLRPRSRSDVL